MAKIDVLVKEFLGLKSIAVIGVSDRRDTGCNSNYRKFKAAGYTVYPVNPRIAAKEAAAHFPITYEMVRPLQRKK